VNQRLAKANSSVPIGLDEKEITEIAWQMAKSKEYQNAKCEYGSSDDDTEFFTVAIPKFDKRYVNEAAGISYGEMRFRRLANSLKTSLLISFKTDGTLETK
jgi:hypothetical protein